ncbi:hypothetical protein DFP72DRAFT_1064344 [Ephemerocybe angulata]|uniref:Uncharacterized protein n=1 Tax=Ephemerocybe angulata TaxID=980116 RepID=A0A8H6I7B9_9AGAR|nr:hypothetical protein DFP72DRAFT_1064344 [Tulosesus angulatus]
MDAADSDVPKLENIDEVLVSKALTEAKKEGVFAGLTGGLASAVIGGRLLKFNRNTTIFCGVVSGVLSGYYFAQAFRTTAIAQLRAEDYRLAVAKAQEAEKQQEQQ